jgi:spermidine synthase
VFLLGLGLGSSVGSLVARGPRSPLVMLGWCQALLIAGLAWAALSIDAWLPYWPVYPVYNPHPWLTFQIDLARALWAVLPAACLWGASFPLALAAAAPRHADSGRTVGAVYAANTVGAILGAVGFSIIVVPAVGTQAAQRVLLAAAAAAVVVVLLARLRETWNISGRLARLAVPAALVAVPLAAAALAYGVPPVPGELYAFGREIMSPRYEPKMLYTGEGWNSSIAVSENPEGARFFHVAGKIEASSIPTDMRLQRMLGHLPALVAKKPRSVLVVGFGAGVTAGTFVTYPGIERILICEIEPLIPQKVAPYFADENYNVLEDPRTEVVYDDARRFILTTNEKFDIITSDPIHPWVKGAATLYTREYFELVKRHLNPGGVVTQWVPLYESTPEVVKSELATFFSVFPGGIVWANDREDGGDLVLLAQADPAPIDVDAAVQLVSANERVAASLRDVGFTSTIDLMSSYAGRAVDLAGWLKHAAITTDRDLRLQYLAGMGVNVMMQDAILAELRQARRLPEGLFVGSATNVAELRSAIESAETGVYSGSPMRRRVR